MCCLAGRSWIFLKRTNKLKKKSPTNICIFWTYIESVIILITENLIVCTKTKEGDTYQKKKKKI